MVLLITVLISGPAYILIFPTRWLVAATIILSQGFGCVDTSGQSKALRPGAAGAAIATIFIMPTLLIVSTRSLRGLSLLGTMRRHGLCLLGAERKRVLVPGVILGRFQGGAVASEAASIHFIDPQRKVPVGLGLNRDSLLEDLVPGVFSTIFLLSLGIDGGPEAVAEQADQDRLQDYRIGIKFLKDGL